MAYSKKQTGRLAANSCYLKREVKVSVNSDSHDTILEVTQQQVYSN